MTVKFARELTEDTAGSGSLPKASATKQKQWLQSNFRLEIKGLPTAKINKIDAITIKQTAVTDDIGDQRDYQKEPGKLEFPNLAFTLPETDAQQWYDWFEDFVLQGNSGDEDEKTAQLTYLGSSLTEQLARLDFFNVGIFKISTDKAEANSDQIKRVKVEQYVERIEFTHLAGALA